MLRTIFLDNDGVLVDTEKYYFEANVATCARYGYALTRDEYQRLFLASGGGLGQVAARLGWSETMLAAVRSERDRCYEELLTTRDISIPGVEEGLARLAGRFILCIVTSSPRPFFDLIHRRTGFGRFFGRIVSEEDVNHHKPDPEPYRVAMQNMDVPPECGIAVEDSARGLCSAVGAGLRCIVVPRPLTADQDFSGAVAVVPDFSSVVTLIESLADQDSPHRVAAVAMRR